MTIATGTILPYGAATAPSGFLLCDGSAVSRTTYATLFGVIGTTFGSGDGSTTFNVPDLRGRIPAGKDNMGGTAASRLTSTTMSPDGNTLGATGGEQTHTLVTSEMPSHSHSLFSDDGGVSALTGISGLGAIATTSYYLVSKSFTGTTTGYYSAGHNQTSNYVQNTGSGGAHNNVQPTLIVSYIIATQDTGGGSSILASDNISYTFFGGV